jgi:hypothetical protein
MKNDDVEAEAASIKFDRSFTLAFVAAIKGSLFATAHMKAHQW